MAWEASGIIYTHNYIVTHKVKKDISRGWRYSLHPALTSDLVDCLGNGDLAKTLLGVMGQQSKIQSP